MIDVFAVSDNIVSPLGLTSEANFSRLKTAATGIRRHTLPAFAADPFFASLLDKEQYTAIALPGYTSFEQLLIASVADALKNSPVDPADPETILIVSSTKGNIGLLETDPATGEEDISLAISAEKLAAHFRFAAKPLVVSNACISGLLGIITAFRLIRGGLYKHAVVTGADRITRFILSGFQSFQAVSAAPCAPFDRDRDGITLGEGAATLILSAIPPAQNAIRVAAGRTGNDANHISGPSRTGRELAHVITRTLADARLDPKNIDFISAHGTATPYNDEMEAKAISIAGVETAPVNSLKGYYGHTLGAAGLIESIITLASMQDNLVLPSHGFRNPGVSRPVNIARDPIHTPLDHCLKTASGFGGCNAAVVFSKSNANR